MHIFGLYWFVNIIVNVGMFVLSGTFSQWYWTQRDDFKDLAKNPVCLSKLICDFRAPSGPRTGRYVDPCLHHYGETFTSEIIIRINLTTVKINSYPV